MYMLAGSRERSDWVRNIVRKSAIAVRIADRAFEGHGRTVGDAQEEALTRRILLEKYSPTYDGDLSEWGRTALPMAIDLAITR